MTDKKNQRKHKKKQGIVFFKSNGERKKNIGEKIKEDNKKEKIHKQIQIQREDRKDN